ncbi:MAG TPA: hypothetical protein VGP38_09265 [Rubrobacter sp.]|nr:hypothetical protein [Rubrobacter sp.]
MAVAGSREEVMRGRVFFQRVGEFARKEVTLALPAAQRAASHGIQAFFKKFSEEYANERKKLKSGAGARSRFGPQGRR